MKQHLYKEKLIKSKRFPKGQLKLVAICGATTSRPDWVRYMTDLDEFKKHYSEYNFSTCKKCCQLSESH